MRSAAALTSGAHELSGVSVGAWQVPPGMMGVSALAALTPTMSSPSLSDADQLLQQWFAELRAQGSLTGTCSLRRHLVVSSYVARAHLNRCGSAAGPREVVLGRASSRQVFHWAGASGRISPAGLPTLGHIHDILHLVHGSASIDQAQIAIHPAPEGTDQTPSRESAAFDRLYLASTRNWLHLLQRGEGIAEIHDAFHGACLAAGLRDVLAGRV